MNAGTTNAGTSEQSREKRRFAWNRRVEFCETDAAGIAHFSSLIVYMEQSEHALLRSLGYSIASFLTSQASEADSHDHLTWPRVRVECDFQSPVRFEDVLCIETWIESLGKKSITYEHEIRLGARLVATGKMTCVCCQVRNGHITSQEIPQRLRVDLSRYMPESHS